MESGNAPRIPLQVTHNSVIASIQVDLSDAVLQQFQADLLELLRSSGATAVILDVSGVQVMDYEDFGALRRTMDMAALMGAQPIIAGLRAGVVSSLVELDANIEGIVATLNLDDAFRLVDAPQGEIVNRGDGENEDGGPDESTTSEL